MDRALDDVISDRQVRHHTTSRDAHGQADKLLLQRGGGGARGRRGRRTEEYPRDGVRKASCCRPCCRPAYALTPLPIQVLHLPPHVHGPP